MTETCQHEKTELRFMEHCKQYRHQCLQCHQSSGDAIAKYKINPDQLPNIKPFDIIARDGYWKSLANKRKQTADEIAKEAEEKLIARKSFYNEYLKSDAWREKRRLVIERQKNICSGCSIAPVQEVHHLSYDNIGDELLWQLQGVCRSCHEKAHNIKKSTNENVMTSLTYYDKKTWMAQIVAMLRHHKLPCSDFNDDDYGYTFHKQIFIKWHRCHDERIYKWLDELPERVLNKLCAASLRKGQLYLYWFGEIPKGYEEGNDIEPTFGDCWYIMFSGAF